LFSSIGGRRFSIFSGTEFFAAGQIVILLGSDFPAEMD